MITEYKLTKGRHYALTVYYVGGSQSDEHGHTTCSRYDVTVSITHISKVLEESECKAGR